MLNYQNKLRAMASKLLMSEEQERRHIATGLYDEILQPLVFLKLKIEHLKKNQADGKPQKEFAQMVELLINLIDIGDAQLGKKNNLCLTNEDGRIQKEYSLQFSGHKMVGQ